MEKFHFGNYFLGVYCMLLVNMVIMLIQTIKSNRRFSKELKERTKSKEAKK